MEQGGCRRNNGRWNGAKRVYVHGSVAVINYHRDNFFCLFGCKKEMAWCFCAKAIKKQPSLADSCFSLVFSLYKYSAGKLHELARRR